MGAPGTLIPADALSGKDTPLKSYSTQPIKLPIADTRVSSHNALGGYNLPFDAMSWKPNTLMSYASSNDGVGTSGLHENVPSANQSGHGVSQGNVSPLYKGGRGPNLAGDSVRVNVNVPYSPKTADDPKYLFADLNPFQIKGSGKPVVQNDLSNEAGKMQFPKNNVISGRPPSPLVWKNRHPLNEAPKDNESGFVEGSFGKNNAGNYKGNATTSVVSGSSKPPAKASKFPTKPFNNSADRRDDTYNNRFRLASGESVHNQLPSEKDLTNNHETHLREDKDTVKKEEPKREDNGNIITRLHEDNNMPDRLRTGNMKMMENEGASNSLGAKYADTEIDDVGDCEIVWEDLVLGERIGLGNVLTSLLSLFKLLSLKYLCNLCLCS